MSPNGEARSSALVAPGRLLGWVAGVQCQGRGRKEREKERDSQPEPVREPGTQPVHQTAGGGEGEERYLLVDLSES